MRHQFFLQLTFILFATHILFAQEIQYRDYKDSVSWENYYDEIENPKYSPFAASTLSFFFPSAGYFYIDEPRRGGYVLLGQVALKGMLLYGYLYILGIAPPIFPGNVYLELAPLYGSIFLSTIYRTWAAIDVGKRCMEKNLAYQKGIFMTLKPDISLTNQFDNHSLTFGIEMKIQF